MTTQYTPDQLFAFKLLIAEYCKDRIILSLTMEWNRYFWRDTIISILDTEWAQIVNDVELGLSLNIKCAYACEMLKMESNPFEDVQAITAPWTQRVVAMQRAGVFRKKGICHLSPDF